MWFDVAVDEFAGVDVLYDIQLEYNEEKVGKSEHTRLIFEWVSVH